MIFFKSEPPSGQFWQWYKFPLLTEKKWANKPYLSPYYFYLFLSNQGPVIICLFCVILVFHQSLLAVNDFCIYHSAVYWTDFENQCKYPICFIDRQKTSVNVIQRTIQSFNHELFNVEHNKLALTAIDDKRFVCEDGVHTRALGHFENNPLATLFSYFSDDESSVSD